MNRLEAALRRAAADLEKEGRQWALAGGFALSARVEPRFTQDIDIAVMVDGDPAAEELVRSLVLFGHLIALKVLARDEVTRPQDLRDLRALISAASPEDLAVARQSVALIEARGFNRERDLGPALESLITDTRADF